MCVVDAAVSGVAQLGDIVYVVYAKSCVIEMFTADALLPLGKGIHIEGMVDPSDIVACHHDRQLYIADYCIWRVSADDHSSIEWLQADTFNIYALSLRSRHLLVTSGRRSVRQYSTSDRRLLCVVELPLYIKELHHAVETLRGTLVVCHKGTSHDQEKYNVSIFCVLKITYHQITELIIETTITR